MTCYRSSVIITDYFDMKAKTLRNVLVSKGKEAASHV